jgi:type I restriction enzyme R subunit
MSQVIDPMWDDKPIDVTSEVNFIWSQSASVNTEDDFRFSYFDDIDDALVLGLEQNQDFFSMLLNNPEIKKQVLGIFVTEVYKTLKNSNQ